MKKLHRFILALLLLLFLFPLNVRAHPGKTDGKGGHTDRSTGEYHYHHGYPEHDHYDMDGDGDVDCPYDFQDLTGVNSGGDSNGLATSRSWNSGIHSYVPPISHPPDVEKEYEEERQVPLWVYFLMAGQAILIICLSLFNQQKKDELHISESQHRGEIASLNERHTKLFNDLTLKLEHAESLVTIYRTRCSDLEAGIEQRAIILAKEQLCQKDNHIRMLQAENKRRILEVSRAKDNIRKIAQIKLKTYDIEYDGEFPTKGPVSKDVPFGDFTVYVSSHGKRYHYDRYCSGGFLRPIHILNAEKRLQPCSKCVFSDKTQAIHAYEQIKMFLDQSETP